MRTLRMVIFCALLSPLLADRISASREEELVPVVIVMESQGDAGRLMELTQGVSPDEGRGNVIAYLKGLRDRSQKEILPQLRIMESSGAVACIRSLWITNVICLKSRPKAIERIAELPGISRIDLDEEHMVMAPKGTMPYVPMERELVWNVAKVRAPEVWALGYTGSNIIVSVMDTGVRYTHFDLADHIWTNPGEIPGNGIDDDVNGYVDDYYGYDFYNDDDDPMDDHGHGTHCAGTVAGDGTAGCTTGVAPDARIMSCKTVSSGGSAAESDGWEALQYAFDNGAHTVVMPYGWIQGWNPDRQQWRNSCDALLAGGMIICVLAGAEDNNYGPPDNVRTPGDCPPPWLHPDQTLIGGLSAVVTAGATDQNDVIASFSSRGPVSWETVDPWFDYDYQPGMGLIDPDIVAPGVNIKSLDNASDSAYDFSSGVSWATAHVSGAVALLLSKNGSLSPAMMDSIIEMTAVDLGTTGKDNDYGAGRLDCYEAIQYTPADIDEDEQSGSFERGPILHVSPNPFTTEVKISLVGEPGNRRNGEAEIRILDVAGRLMRTISLLPFTFSLAVTWDGRDESGRRVSPGIYFVRLQAEGYSLAKAIILLE
jgi:hypothetical protein